MWWRAEADCGSLALESLVAHCGAVWCPFDFQVSRSSGTRALPALKAEAWNNAKDGLESKRQLVLLAGPGNAEGWLESNCKNPAHENHPRCARIRTDSAPRLAALASR